MNKMLQRNLKNRNEQYASSAVWHSLWMCFMLGNIWLINPGSQDPYDDSFCWPPSGPSPRWKQTAVSLLPDCILNPYPNPNSSNWHTIRACLGETEKTGVSLAWLSTFSLQWEKRGQCLTHYYYACLDSTKCSLITCIQWAHRHWDTHFHLWYGANASAQKWFKPPVVIVPPLAYEAPATHCCWPARVTATKWLNTTGTSAVIQNTDPKDLPTVGQLEHWAHQVRRGGPH